MQDRRTPILGDEVYGNSDWNKRYRRTNQIKRPLLHSYETEFVHPFSGKKLTLHAPIPPDMKDIISKIALHSGARGELINSESGLLQCTTEVHGVEKDCGIEDPDGNIDIVTEGIRPQGTFVPLERLALDEDAYDWQAEVDPAVLGWDVL